MARSHSLSKHPCLFLFTTVTPLTLPLSLPPLVQCAVFCQIPCLNGGRCIGRDQCWCPSNSTGKFCHLPAAPARVAPHSHRDPNQQPPKPPSHSMYTLPLSNQQGNHSSCQLRSDLSCSSCLLLAWSSLSSEGWKSGWCNTELSELSRPFSVGNLNATPEIYSVILPQSFTILNPVCGDAFII